MSIVEILHASRKWKLISVIAVLSIMLTSLELLTAKPVAASPLPLSAAAKWNDKLCENDGQACLLGDVDGDGDDDAVEFNKSGSARGRVSVSLSDSGRFIAPTSWSNYFCVDSETCTLADVDGDDRDDVIALVKDHPPQDHPDQAGDVWVALSSGTNFGVPKLWSGDACTHGEECQIADVDDREGAELIQINKNSSPSGQGKILVARNTNESWANFATWHDHFCVGEEICRVGDVNGDGKSDLISFVRSAPDQQTTAGDVFVSLSRPDDGLFGPAELWHDNFCLDKETCDVADMNGDGRADLVAFVKSTRSDPDTGDMWVALSRDVKPGSAHMFAGATQWADYICVAQETCAVADVNGEGKADGVAFVGSGNSSLQGDVYVSTSGPTGCWGAELCNPCVNDVAGSINSKLRDHGDVMGFNIGGGMPTPEYSYISNPNDHLQGVQRLTADNGKWLAVSYDDKGDGPGGVGFVHLTSRAPSQMGGRLRTNRAAGGKPPVADAAATTVDSGTRELWHAGGMQTLGTYLAVPYEGDANTSEVRIYDVHNPESPTLKYTLPRQGKPNSGNVGWTRLPNGEFLLMVGGFNSQPLDFYTSKSITGPYAFASSWKADSSSGPFQGYQSTNIVSECGTGKLFIIGNYDDHGITSDKGVDWVHVFSLGIARDGSNPNVKNVGNRHMFCSAFGDEQCNFNAAGGAYVSADHELYFYATEHDNSGPDGSVKFSEFRTVTPNIDECSKDPDQAWVELYENSNFGGRSVIIDYADRSVLDFSNMARYSFGDSASSARWCLPAGLSSEVFSDSDFRGSRLIFSGAGEDADLARSPSISNFGDIVSSQRFVSH
ncbi:VCBS repeat-containing protein [Streptomyces sp900105245]|uniref:VCBS repeat-containing protein n=1 Tax=Streptomyces sp. 900105245 TaxID=3154379 RepID=A0ABV1UKY4_9ACTN